MQTFIILLMVFLIICAIAVSFCKNLMNSVLIFMSYSLIMSIIWVCLESPDLAITEAAVGAGVTTVLFIATLKKLRSIGTDDMVKKGSLEAMTEGDVKSTKERDVNEWLKENKEEMVNE